MIDSLDDSGPRIGINLDERSVRALYSAVEYTLRKWAGESEMDQEALLALKSSLQGAVFELEFHR